MSYEDERSEVIRQTFFGAAIFVVFCTTVIYGVLVWLPDAACKERWDGHGSWSFSEGCKVDGVPENTYRRWLLEPSV